MNSSNNTGKQSGAGSQFGKHLSREKINAARKDQPESKGLDDFEKDALEGWRKASAGTEMLMRNNDRKFMIPSRTPLWIAAIVLLLAGIGFMMYRQFSQPEFGPIKIVTVDKSDVVIPENIEKLEELPAGQQISPKQVVSNFKGKQQQQEEKQGASPSPAADEGETFVLPLKKVQVYANKPKLTIDRKWAKEVYLSGMKLVDYRTYRSRQEIPSEQRTMSGTPADQERTPMQLDDPEWQAIDIPYHDYISQTMEQFAAGNFKQALNRTNFVLKFYPDDINALFYGGLCYYNLNEADQAVNAFQRVISNPFSNFDEEALWYLANAYDLKNDKAKAREIFQEIVAQKGFYAKQAEKMLRK